MWLALELVGAYVGGVLTCVVAAGLVARRKVRELRALMGSPLTRP
jgi:hypothetical protein